MGELKTSKKGLDYLDTNLKKTDKTITKAFFWQIRHNSGIIEVSLKVGKYKPNATISFIVEPLCTDPKSEVTLDQKELNALIDFISQNYKPIKDGVKKYISIEADFDSELALKLKAIFEHPDKRQVLDFIIENKLLPNEILQGLELKGKVKAIEEFQEMLAKDLLEYDWQNWFQKNDWVLGSEFVCVLDERNIDTNSITDFLMRAHDGFIDIIEIKRPDRDLTFWHSSKDHNNYIPSLDLIKAITQASKYINEIEKRANDLDFHERADKMKVIKPRCVLIFGRSNNWNGEQREAYRILNASYHNLTILTYDHVLARASRILGSNNRIAGNEITV